MSIILLLFYTTVRDVLNHIIRTVYIYIHTSQPSVAPSITNPTRAFNFLPNDRNLHCICATISETEVV